MSYRSAIVGFYTRNPDATQEQVRRATGAPKSAVRFVHASLVRSGLLPRVPDAIGRLRACAEPSGLTA